MIEPKPKGALMPIIASALLAVPKADDAPVETFLPATYVVRACNTRVTNGQAITTRTDVMVAANDKPRAGQLKGPRPAGEVNMVNREGLQMWEYCV